MVKRDDDRLLERWRQAEDQYQARVRAILEGRARQLDKPTVVAVTKARVKADTRMQEYFRRCLDAHADPQSQPDRRFRAVV
jgi:hypothetical protein